MSEVPLKKALTFLKDYRLARSKALNNEERMKWFTEPLEKLDDLFDDEKGIFSTKESNDAWETLKNTKTADTLKLRELQTEVAFLAGCYRDLRMLFAVGENNEPRTELDYDRFEYMRVAFNQHKMELLQKILTSQKKGFSTSK